MSELSEKTAKLGLVEFVRKAFVLPAAKINPDIASCARCITMLSNSIRSEIPEDELTSMTVQDFLDRYSKQELGRLPNVGKKTVAAFEGYLACFGLRLRGSNAELTPHTVSAEAGAVLELLRSTRSG